MTHLRKTIWIAAAAALLLVAPACDDVGAVASSDSTIEVNANPATLTLAPGASGNSTITAVVLDMSGVPQSGVGVRFTTDAGSLASNGSVKTTDSRGEVTDTLTTDRDATVTATSGSVTGSATVTVASTSGPTAVLDINPPFEASAGSTVQFSGGASVGDITQYKFAIVSTAPDMGQPNPEVVTQSIATLNRTYTGAQSLDVTLEVTDSNGLKDTDAAFYDIVANLAPTAMVSPASQTGAVTGSAATMDYACTAQVSACTSSDPDGVITAYEIFWGDGMPRDLSFGSSPCSFQHTYTTAAPTGYTVTVTVFDDGDGSAPCTAPMSEAELTACASRLNDQTTVTIFCPSA